MSPCYVSIVLETVCIISESTFSYLPWQGHLCKLLCKCCQCSWGGEWGCQRQYSTVEVIRLPLVGSLLSLVRKVTSLIWFVLPDWNCQYLFAYCNRNIFSMFHFACSYFFVVIYYIFNLVTPYPVIGFILLGSVNNKKMT